MGRLSFFSTVTLAALLIAVRGYEVDPFRPGHAEGRGSLVLVTEGDVGEPGEFALGELESVLTKRGIAVTKVTGPVPVDGPRILAGITEHAPQIRALLDRRGDPVPREPESYVIRRTMQDGQPGLLVAGADDTGVMYGLFEVSRLIDRISSPITAEDLVSRLRETEGRPAIRVRGMIQFLHSADLERNWYHDRDYWRTYLGMLARNRFNSFNLVFAHQTHYLAPPYPFLFTVEKYPQVRVPGLSDAEQGRNLDTLRMISRMARERGIDFIMGIWEHRAWQKRQPSMVEGLTDGILSDYARLAMEKLLRLCPDVSGIQLRVNSESGIDEAQQAVFYRDGVMAGMRAAGRPVILDVRGWGASPETIDAAAASGLPMRLSMKYWAEFMGMPYQAAEMLPSYSYADFLRYPRRFPVLYQVWSLGSHRVLPWGSVNWVKRFVPTARLGDGIGFETCAPLSQKGFGNPPGDWRILLSPQREYYRWEFERYWLYYLLYGRLSYDPEASSDVWMDEFRSRFGEKGAAPVFEAFQSASEVIPFLVSYRLSNPNMYIWPEKQMGGLLDFYIEVKPADAARFADFREHVARRLHGVVSAKMTPEEASLRLRQMAEAVERALSDADAAIGSSPNREYAANRTDLSVLALLARYHSRKILAGAGLALFYASGDYAALRAARSHAAAGLEIWQRLARLTEEVYHPKMIFGPQDTGHWKDNLVFVRHDVERLGEVEELFDRYGLFDLGLDFGPKVATRRHPYEPQYAATYSVERRFQALDKEMVYSPTRGFGWREAVAIEASRPMRIPYTSLEGDNLDNLGLPRRVLSGDFLRGTGSATLLIDLPDGNYRVVCIVANTPELAGNPFEVRARSGGDTVSLRYELGETGDKGFDVRVGGGQLSVDFVPEQGGDWLLSGLTVTLRRPHFGHVPIRRAAPGSKTVLTATVLAPDGIRTSSLHLIDGMGREVAAMPMVRDGRQYEAAVRWPSVSGDMGYFIAATDQVGQAARIPADGWFKVQVGADSEPPRIRHSPAATCEPGQELRLEFEIEDASTLARARLFYRHLTQTEKYVEADLSQAAGKYVGTIPGRFITGAYDVMYYVEAVDRFGNGVFYPDPDRTVPYVIVRSAGSAAADERR